MKKQNEHKHAKPEDNNMKKHSKRRTEPTSNTAYDGHATNREVVAVYEPDIYREIDERNGWSDEDTETAQQFDPIGSFSELINYLLEPFVNAG